MSVVSGQYVSMSVCQWSVVSKLGVSMSVNCSYIDSVFVICYNNFSFIMKGCSVMIYKELTVWKKSMELVKEIYTLTKKLPKEEMYGLSDQMRRAAVSIPSNIAEGNGRKTDVEYARFLNISRGSECELETQLYICVMLNYLTENETEKAFELLSEIGKMLNTLITKLTKNQH